MSEITEAQLQELERRHFAVLLNRNSLESCRVDGETWPCAVNQLTKALRAAREPLRCHAHCYATSDTSRWFRDEDGREVEVRPYADGTVDEIVTDEIHLEQMDRNAYWMRINGVSFNFYARGKITLTCEPDTAKEIVVPLAETCEGNGCGIFATNPPP